MNTTHLPLIFESHLPNRHTPIFLQVRPRRVHNRNIIFLVTLDTIRLCQLRAVSH